jgi:ribosomal protein S18 acetylase RimI-like enzyme
MPAQAPDVVVRGITFGDIPGFGEAVGSVAAERLYLARTSPFPLDASARFVAANIAGGHPQFVADAGGEIVGWCDIHRSDQEVSQHVGILGMGVLRPWRRRGIGRRLIVAALDAARGVFEQVQLDVYATNRHAIALYASVGFVEQGRRRRGRKLDGVYDDIVLMTRFLDEPL